MEPLAVSLDIPRNSGVYNRAQEIYHRLRLRAGHAKFSAQCCMAAAFQLSADSFNYKLDSTVTSRKAAVTIKVLTDCLEFVVGSVGIEVGLLSMNLVAEAVGFPRMAQVASDLLDAVQAKLVVHKANEMQKAAFMPSNKTIAAAILLAHQTLGIRTSKTTVCSKAHVNNQIVQRCMLEMKSIIPEYLEQLARDTQLANSIKGDGQHRPAKKMGKVESKMVEESSTIPTPTFPKLSYMESHYLHDLGYAFMLNSPIQSG
jgi:hypothetical protein